MPSGEMLRNEILGFQKAQAELLRWKLIATGAIAATAFGVAAAGQSARLLVLAIVPLVSVYCDLLSRDYNIRIALISAFFRRQESEFRDYEEFIREPGVGLARPWFFGNAATLMSSVVVCIFVIWVGIQPQLIAGEDVAGSLKTLIVAGAAGIVAALVIQWYFSQAMRRIAAASCRKLRS